MEEQVSTAGAVHGGETAAFLQEGEDDSSGEGLIESLQREEAQPVRAVERAVEEAPAKSEVRDEVLDDLLQEEEQDVHQAPNTDVPDAPSGVDSSLIEGLIEDDDDRKDQGS